MIVAQLKKFKAKYSTVTALNEEIKSLKPMDLSFTTLNKSGIGLGSQCALSVGVAQFLRQVWLSLNARIYSKLCILRIHWSQLRRGPSQCGAPRSPYSRISDVTDRLFFSMWLDCCSNSLCPILQLIRRLEKK